MKKLEFETSKGRFLLIEEECVTKEMYLLSEFDYSLKEITEEQASEIVDDFKYHPTLIKKVFIDYFNEDFYLDSAIESLHSLLKSKGIYLYEKPYLPEELINNQEAFMADLKAEQKTFYNPYIFKLCN